MKRKITAVFISLLLIFEQTLLPVFAQEPIQIDPATSIPVIPVSQVVPAGPDPIPFSNISSLDQAGPLSAPVENNAPAAATQTRMSSPYENNIPANVLYWDLAQMNDSAGGFDHMDIYRRDPGSSEYHAVGRINHLANRYVDYDIQTDYSPFDSYDYEVRITRADGTTYSFKPEAVNKVNYGQKDLQPENVLVIASNHQGLGGDTEAILDNGIDPLLDLVDYYMTRRNIPSQNLIRLDIQEDENYTVEQFKTKILMPIYNYLVANNLQNKIWALTTLPGAHVTVSRISVETMIASLLPVLFRGEDVNAYIESLITDKVNGFASPNPNAGSSNTDYLLKTTLGYTRLDAPETVIDGVTLTPQENLKRLIDQTIEAEERAQANREAGITPDYYVHLFDMEGPQGVYGGQGGDPVFEAMKNLLAEYGYTTYVDNSASPLYSILNQDLLKDLSDGTKELMGLAGWYWVNEGRYSPLYRFIESIGGFDLGGAVSPLDSGFASGWEALKHDGVVMAANAQFEPFIGGTATIASAFLFTGTPLAFAAALASSSVRWAANVFGDPLYNIGKFILDKVKDVFDAVGNLLGTREIIETGNLNPQTGLDGNKLDRRETSIDVFRNLEGLITESRTGIGTEKYLEDGTMVFTSTKRTEISGQSYSASEYTYDSMGRIVQEKRVQQNGIYTRDFKYDESREYDGFITHNPDGSSEEFDSFNRRLIRDSSGNVIRADHFRGVSVWPRLVNPSELIYRKEYFNGNGYPSKVAYVEDIRYFRNSPIIRQRHFDYTEDGKIARIETKDLDEEAPVSSMTLEYPLDNPWKPGVVAVTYASGEMETRTFDNLFTLFDDIYRTEPQNPRWVMSMIAASLREEISKRQLMPANYLEEFDLDGNGIINTADVLKVSGLATYSSANFSIIYDKLKNAAGKRMGKRSGDENFLKIFDIDAFEDYDGDSKVDGDGIVDQKDLDILEDFLWFGRTDRPAKKVIEPPPVERSKVAPPPPAPSSGSSFSPPDDEFSRISAEPSSELKKKKKRRRPLSR